MATWTIYKDGYLGNTLNGRSQISDDGDFDDEGDDEAVEREIKNRLIGLLDLSQEEASGIEVDGNYMEAWALIDLCPVCMKPCCQCKHWLGFADTIDTMPVSRYGFSASRWGE